MKNVALILMVILLSLVLGVAWFTSPTQAAPNIPPLPPVTPSAAPKPEPRITGGIIELRVQFPTDWPWAEIHLPDLWTVVQMRDAKKGWQDITEGWQGTLDTFERLEGRKTWYVAEEDLGARGYRWVVYRGQGGELLGASKAFDLPERARQTVIVELMLELPE